MKAYYNDLKETALSVERKQKIGSGQRADKIRTYREQDDMVTDHITGKKTSLKSIRNGSLEKLW